MNTLVYYRGVADYGGRTERVAESKHCAVGVERRRRVGNEIKCAMRIGKKRSVGKVLLETSEIIFRGDTPLKIPFAKMKSVRVLNGDLLVQVGDELLAFEVGEKAAPKWREKILHPKSRVEKLGVKAGARVSVIGDFAKDFLQELAKLKCLVKASAVVADAEWIFVLVESEQDLQAVAKLAKKMEGSVGLWVVYAKGRRDISEIGVISTGRKAGLKDVKVVGFSATHTALKFVIPLADR
jgi:hypothetical protein